MCAKKNTAKDKVFWQQGLLTLWQALRDQFVLQTSGWILWVLSVHCRWVGTGYWIFPALHSSLLLSCHPATKWNKTVLNTLALLYLSLPCSSKCTNIKVIYNENVVLRSTQFTSVHKESDTTDQVRLVQMV